MAIRSYERDFGFETGQIRGWPWNPEAPIWGITRVTPGGRMDRAGFRSGDAVFTQHGSGHSDLHGALWLAGRGRIGCVDLVNVEDYRTRNRGREVCLNGTSQK